MPHGAVTIGADLRLHRHTSKELECYDRRFDGEKYETWEFDVVLDS